MRPQAHHHTNRNDAQSHRQQPSRARQQRQRQTAPGPVRQSGPGESLDRGQPTIINCGYQFPKAHRRGEQQRHCEGGDEACCRDHCHYSNRYFASSGHANNFSVFLSSYMDATNSP